jgi:hypothetical protein
MKVSQHEPPELLRYFVESRSDPENPHLVDLLDWQCSCDDWRFRCQADPQAKPCDHILAALQEWSLQTLGAIRALTETRHGP